MHHQLLLAHKALKDKYKLLQAELSSKGTEFWPDIAIMLHSPDFLGVELLIHIYTLRVKL